MSTTPVEQAAVKGANEKYCMDCGKIILLRAEICPHCGCRQAAAPAVVASPAPVYTQSDPIVGPMILLFVLNFLWNGLGNIAVGDKRGWAYGFLNWIFVIISIFTLWIPCLGFFAYCGYQGYTYLRNEKYPLR